MAKFELSIAKDYVPSWTYLEGVREIFQNALDEQTRSRSNKMFFDYDEEGEVLSIGNKESVLCTSSLLLGASTKPDDEDAIGQFGEGYKIATLVLTREGHPVTFYNYGKKEVWSPRFVNSRRYNAEVLTFFVDKKYPWQGTPHHNLVVTIGGITKSMYDNIVNNNLHLLDVGKTFDTKKGRILLEKRFKGKVFVNGLYVCNYKSYEYGYDFIPSAINIDRDRKLVDNFDLRSLASKMWLDQSSDEMREIAANLVSKGAADVSFISFYGSSSDSYKETSDIVYNKFKEEHGEKAVPVSDQSEMESIAVGYKPIVVPDSHRLMIVNNQNYKEPEKIYKPNPAERLKEWIENHKQSLSKKAIYEINSIAEDIDNGYYWG